MRSPFLRSTLLAVSVFVPLLACGGHVVSLGSNTENLQSIDPAKVSGGVSACPAGYQHPNVCCSGGPNEPSTCGAYVQHPFHPCAPGTTTYPNPLSCCSLTDGTCVDTPPDAGPPPPPVCVYACPPGWWPARAGNVSSPIGAPDGCCRTLPDGSVECSGYDGVAQADAGCPVPVFEDAGAPTPADASTPIQDAGPAPDAWAGDGGAWDGAVDADVDADVDGGVADASADVIEPPPYDGGCGAVDAGPAPAPPGTCTETCPAGWGPDPSQPDVCCRDLADGSRECFSQATPGNGGWGPPVAVDAGPAVGRTCYGGAGGPNDTPNATCGCTEYVSGHDYRVDCSDGSHACGCTIDGNAVDSLPQASAVCSSPSSLDAIWKACGFPQ